MQFCLRFVLLAWLATGSAFGFLGFESRETISAGELPVEARQTLMLIKTGGPFPYSRDGITFKNFEKRLPVRARGYYSEYTVKTPGRRDRGPRRIVAGEGGEYFYTDDHYKTFRRIRE